MLLKTSNCQKLWKISPDSAIKGQIIVNTVWQTLVNSRNGVVFTTPYISIWIFVTLLVLNFPFNFTGICFSNHFGFSSTITLPIITICSSFDHYHISTGQYTMLHIFFEITKWGVIKADEILLCQTIIIIITSQP